MSKAASLCCVLLMVASPTAAQMVTSLQSATPEKSQAVVGDPNKIICESVKRTGSRLAVDKVCMTAAQWADHKDGHRHDLEAVQQVKNQEPADPNALASPR